MRRRTPKPSASKLKLTKPAHNSKVKSAWACPVRGIPTTTGVGDSNGISVGKGAGSGPPAVGVAADGSVGAAVTSAVGLPSVVGVVAGGTVAVGGAGVLVGGAAVAVGCARKPTQK